MTILEKVMQAIERYALLSPGESVLVGVSGGADSLCLMMALRDLGYQVIVAHLDHQLRSESGDEARFVEMLAIKAGLKAIVEKGDLQILINQGHSIEEAARLVRYRFLVQAAARAGARSIATGHTADDQIETVLMHFLRGAGPSGLAGMAPKTMMESWSGFAEARGVILIRPLLEIRRHETEAYCQEMDLPACMDPSNLDLAFYRNRIRHHLIPILKGYNPGIEQVVLRMAKVMAGEADRIKQEVAKHWDEIVIHQSEGCMLFGREALLSLSTGLRRSFLRQAIEMLVPGIRDIGFEQVEQGLALLEDEKTIGRIALGRGLVLTKHHHWILLQELGRSTALPQFPQLEVDQPIQVSIPCSLALKNGWRFLSSQEDAPEEQHREILSSLPPYKAAFDAETLGCDLKLRTIQAGDRIEPLGMQGRMKVSELFINAHIPSFARSGWPLLLNEERMIWVIGLRIAHPNRITPKTRKVTVFEMRPPLEERYFPIRQGKIQAQ